jgi:dihydrofolate reductase
MRRLVVFNHVTLDGFFTDMNSDMSFAHNPIKDEEWDAFVEGNAAGGGALVFGRVTYEMMAGYWPTHAARKSFPRVAEGMNSVPKIVFSRTMDKASWNNTRLVKGDAAEEMRKIKKEPGKDMAILGSGRVVSRLAQEGLIDEFQVVVNPVVLGKGKTMFDGVTGRLSLRLIRDRTFANGNVLLCYEPVG